MFDIFDQMTFAFQQDFGLYILLGAIVFGFVLSFAVAPLSNFVTILIIHIQTFVVIFPNFLPWSKISGWSK